MPDTATNTGKQVFIGDTAIYHCTPLTPRAALEAIGIDRNFCVSFWRPDDAEVVERIASTVMFRQRCVQRVAGGNEARAGMVRAGRLVAVLPVAGTAPARQSVGDHTGRTGRTFPAQRCAADRLAFWTGTLSPGLAHGCTCRAPAATVRPLPARLHGMDRDGGGQSRWLPSVVRAHVRDCAQAGRPVAADPSPARRVDRAGVSLCERGREQRRAERMAV